MYGRSVRPPTAPCPISTEKSMGRDGEGEGELADVWVSVSSEE